MSKFNKDLGVIGLGYVGLPLVVESCNSGLKVFGYDNNSLKVESLKKGISPIEDISDAVSYTHLTLPTNREV